MCALALLSFALAAPASARTLAPGVLFEVIYAYDSLGRPASRTVNGELQIFEYDGRDRLVAVRAEDGSDIERYRYDAAGNILEKAVRGETTRFAYDAANQLVSRTDGSGMTAFAYDAAGRLVREGDKRFVYGNDGHVSQVLEGGTVVASFDYFLDGQVAAVHARGRTERFLWDGLAMVARGSRTFLNEPAPTGGNPIASMGRSFLNDMLGSTVGVHERKAKTGLAVSMTLFGETDADEAYFTGKPELPELGYAFLVRSYRADLGKWQTRDPFGYPDGWNAMAYCGNRTTLGLDLFGCYSFPKTPDPEPDQCLVGIDEGWFNTYEYYAITSYAYFWKQVDRDQTFNIADNPMETSLTLTESTTCQSGWKQQTENIIASTISGKLDAYGVSLEGNFSASYSLLVNVFETVGETREKSKTFTMTLPERTGWEVVTYQLFCTATVYLEKRKNGNQVELTQLVRYWNIPIKETASTSLTWRITE